MVTPLIKAFLAFLIFFYPLFGKENNITLQLSWFNQFQFAGYYIAKEKGFYKDLGLNVKIKPFEFGLDITNDVSNGKIDFAIGRETLILEKSNNKKIVALYALFQASPLVLLSTKKSNINKITDFKDKRIMTTIDDSSEVSIKAMITSQKLDLKNLNFIPHTHNINDLIDGKTDVISAYLSKSPYLLQKMKIPYNSFSPKDYGFDMYSDLLYTSESKVKNDLDTVLNFKEASLKGWEYAYLNIEEAVDLILAKYNTQNLTKDELIFEANELKKLSFYETDTLGQIDLNKLQRIYDLYNIMGLIKNKIDIKSFVLEKSSLVTYLKKVMHNLSKYIGLPYIYFFISLFILLILYISYKNLILNKLTKKLKENEDKLIIMNDKLKEISEKDHLTKLYNRRHFEMVSREYALLAKRENKNVSILMIDIDNFKSINDNYSHQVGDKVLCFIASEMMSHKRQSDVVARYGGEEFVILLPNTSLVGAETFSENLRKAIEEKELIIDNIKLKLTVSMGLTIFNANDTIFSALDRADEGMYKAKNNGKNQLYII